MSGMDAQAWDARYAGSADLVWGGEPNRFVAAELGGLPPGRALDVACGEGRNAVWLATRGWEATGVDFSAAGLARARRLAEEAGVADRVTLVVSDVVHGPLPAGPFDAVVVAYVHLPAEDRRRVVRAAAAALTEGGVLLVVGHDSANLAEGVGGPQDPAVLFTAEDLVADLADLPGMVVEKAERVERVVATPDGERVALDALLRVRRTSS